MLIYILSALIASVYILTTMTVYIPPPKTNHSLIRYAHDGELYRRQYEEYKAAAAKKPLRVIRS